MSLYCRQEDRRDAVRRMEGRNGLDYVEVIGQDQLTLHVYFLGKLPLEFQPARPKKLSSRPIAATGEITWKKPGMEKHLRLEGGRRVTDIRITEVIAHVTRDLEKDDFLEVRLDQCGDFSTYTLWLVGVRQIDPGYDRVEFSFKIDCRSDLDCAPARVCESPAATEPEINYLAKDYASFRQLLLDRLALLIPDWKERHAPDLGIALVELLAYTGDYLSYYQDAVGTEAYLDTARRRISLRRHARLVDYRLHEGCNARAWVCVETEGKEDGVSLLPKHFFFVTRLDRLQVTGGVALTEDDLRNIPAGAYEVFEPLVKNREKEIRFYPSHNRIPFYTWGNSQCCLPRGATRATLRDVWIDDAMLTSTTKDSSKPAISAGKEPEQRQPGKKRRRALRLKVGDVLIFEEVIGSKTGNPADADPARRHAVRLTRVTPGEDPVIKTEKGQPTPYVEIQWAPEDALPFPFCLTAIGPADGTPSCALLKDVSIARGNVILVDHGKTLAPEDLGLVPTLRTETVCECVDHSGEIRIVPGKFRPPPLAQRPLTYAQPLLSESFAPASILLSQDPREALPQIELKSASLELWRAQNDLIESGPRDRHFVVEIDNEGRAHLRFGDGESGHMPEAGMAFQAIYRIGNGSSGNVGAETISHLVLRNMRLSGVLVSARNLLPAQGGADAEPMAEAKLYAPHTFHKRLERAITAEDYARLAERNSKAQKASAALAWTGSWYEADVAIDPFGSENADPALLEEIAGYLHKFHRMGHDLRVMSAQYVPLDLKLEVCVLSHDQRAHVKAALFDVFSHRALPDGRKGFFHPDHLTFGEGIYLSKIIAAAQAVPGVESVTVKRFQRLFEAENGEIVNGVMRLGANEIAQLDNDPNYPERGKLEIEVCGGR